MHKLLISSLILLLFFAACKKDNPVQQPDASEQLLTRLRIEGSSTPVLDIDYEQNKPAEVREFSRNGVLTRYRFFGFDTKGRIIRFEKQAPSTTPGNPALKFELDFTGDFLDNILITKNISGTPTLAGRFVFDIDSKDIISFRENESDDPVNARSATYDENGNVVRLITRTLPGGKPDTTDMSNYDSHPNAMAPFARIIGDNDFLLPSGNNPGRIVNKRGAVAPLIDSLKYEYNSRGNVVKIIQSRQTLLLEYKDLSR